VPAPAQPEKGTGEVDLGGDAYSRLITEERTPAPKPLSMLTTPTVGAQELSIPSRAATPPKLAP